MNQLIVVIFLLGLIIAPTPVLAGQEVFILPKNEVVNKDLFAAGERVEISGSVALIIGLIAYTILKFIPIVSLIVVFLAITLGLGAFASSITSVRKAKKSISKR